MRGGGGGGEAGNSLRATIAAENVLKQHWGGDTSGLVARILCKLWSLPLSEDTLLEEFSQFACGSPAGESAGDAAEHSAIHNGRDITQEPCQSV